MNQPQVSIFPAEMTTALYRRAIASAWRQKMLNETGSDQYGPHSLRPVLRPETGIQKREAGACRRHFLRGSAFRNRPLTTHRQKHRYCVFQAKCGPEHRCARLKYSS